MEVTRLGKHMNFNIRKNIKANHNSQQGSMTVEAVIVLPVFLLFFMFMIYMVNICNAYLALNHAADQINKYNSNSIYVRYAIGQGINEGADIEKHVSEFFEKYISKSDMFNEAMGSYASELSGKLFDKGIAVRVAKIYKKQSQKNLDIFLTDTIVEPKKVQISMFKVPRGKLEAKGKNKKYKDELGDDDLLIQLTYTMKLNLPLIGTKDFKIYSTCLEKVWMGTDVKRTYVSFEQRPFLFNILEYDD